MKTFELSGHQKPISQIKYNREGDLLFSSGKGSEKFGDPSVWSTETGERIGTYIGHTGAVMGLDVNQSSTLLATAGADQCCKIWDVESGKELKHIEQPTPVQCVAWGHGDRLLATVTDKKMRNTPSINIYMIPEKDQIAEDKVEYVPFEQYKQPEMIRWIAWGPDNSSIYFCSEDGSVAIYDVETGKEKCYQVLHGDNEQVAEKNEGARRFQWDSDYTMLITAGGDKAAHLLDARDVSKIRSYHHDFPLNDAAIIPNHTMNHVFFGGGISAQSVTQVSAAQNKFDIKFCHKVFGDDLGVISSGHFGPVNSLACEPNGYGFASGGEDGVIRMHQFDSEYYKSPGNVSEFE